MFYLTMYTFYLWLYGIGHIVKDTPARQEILYHHFMGYSFRLTAKDLFYAPSLARLMHVFVIPVVKHWLE